MITEDYVSFEVAKLLKKKGFDEECWEYYDNNKNFKSFRIVRCNYDNIPYKDAYIAPTFQMAMKWLRENYKLHIEVGFTDFHPKGYKCKIYFIDDRFFTVEHKKDGFLSYEEAVEAALKYCLTKVI